MVIFILFEIILGLFLTYNKLNSIRIEQQKLWVVTFFILILFTLISDSYIKDPFNEYFVQPDQMLFYRYALDLSDLNWTEIVDRCFTTFEYSGSPGAFCLFGAIVKIGKSLGIIDLLLFLKSTVVFLSSFIPVFIFKIVKILNPAISNLVKLELPFVIFSPMLLLSSILMRDIHIALLFTILVYVAIKPKMKLRFIVMTLLVLMTFTFRVENGMFALVFFCIPVYKIFNRSNIFGKIILIIISLIIILFFAGSILYTMNNTLDSYTERSLEYSSNDSLGAKLQALPVPINYIAKTLFAQLLPFPIWFPFISGDTHLEYTYLRIVECFNPIFWIPIMAFVLFVFCRYSKVINKDLKIIFYLSLIYLFVCSMSEFNTRRLFAVYPIIFSIFLIVKTQFNIKMYKFNMLSYTALIFLHLIYLIIK